MDTEPHDRTCIFLSWSGESSKAMGLALDQLVATTFGGRVTTWQSSRDLRGSDWRRGIQTAVRGSKVAILMLAPGTLASMWMMYEAGAFFHEDGKPGPDGTPVDTVFVLGCGVEATALANTPLNALQLWDAHDEAQVRAMLESVATTLGQAGPDAATSFAKGWHEFATAMSHIRSGLHAAEQARARETAARQRAEAVAAAALRRRRRWLVAAAATVVAIVTGAPWVWTFWPAPPPTAVARCSTGTDRERADCEWEAYLKEKAEHGAKANRNLPTQISRRPFAVVALTASCDEDAATTGTLIVTQGAARTGWSVPVVFAKSSSDTGTGFSALALDAGTAVTVLRVEGCRALDTGAMRVHYIGTLSNDRICHKLSEVREAFHGVAGFEEQMADHWSKHGLGTKSELEPEVRKWMRLCGV